MELCFCVVEVLALGPWKNEAEAAAWNSKSGSGTS